MIDVFKSAMEIQTQLPREILAHTVSAEYHRRWNMRLGVLSTVLTTLVSTAIFTGLVSQLGLNGKGTIRNPLTDHGMDWLYLIVIILSISAPIISALHTFMHHAEDASRLSASVEGYSSVLRRLTTFPTKYEGSNSAGDKKLEALKEYDEIMKEYNFVLGKRITITNHEYKKADKRLGTLERAESLGKRYTPKLEALMGCGLSIRALL